MESSGHGEEFTPLGDGFEQFTRRLPDDCVEYAIYLINTELHSIAATRSRLNEILRAAADYRKTRLRDYIWQREPFSLKLQHRASKGRPNPPFDAGLYLQGQTNFGDSIADEWLIVYILLELSKQFVDAWIRVYDTDGAFLLIEAANALPKWLNPDVAENRVWINNGHLRIIPISSEGSPRSMTLMDAVSFIQKSPEKVIISPFIEDEAFFRLTNDLLCSVDFVICL